MELDRVKLWLSLQGAFQQDRQNDVDKRLLTCGMGWPFRQSQTD